MKYLPDKDTTNCSVTSVMPGIARPTSDSPCETCEHGGKCSYITASGCVRLLMWLEIDEQPPTLNNM